MIHYIYSHAKREVHTIILFFLSHTQTHGKRSLLQKSERRKATKKNIENQCLFSSSLLQKSERRKE